MYVRVYTSAAAWQPQNVCRATELGAYILSVSCDRRPPRVVAVLAVYRAVPGCTLLLVGVRRSQSSEGQIYRGPAAARVVPTRLLWSRRPAASGMPACCRAQRGRRVAGPSARWGRIPGRRRPVRSRRRRRGTQPRPAQLYCAHPRRIGGSMHPAQALTAGAPETTSRVEAGWSSSIRTGCPLGPPRWSPRRPGR